MEPATREALHQAYRLIKAEQNDRARAILKPVLAADRDNIDAWWLAAFAASNPTDRRLALNQVLRLNPDHWPARALLDQIDRAAPITRDELAAQVTLPTRDRRTLAQRPPSRRFRWVWNLVLLIGLLSFAFAGLAFVSNLLGLSWFDALAENISQTVGLDDAPDKNFGMITGGNPYDPAQTYDIPITKMVAIRPGETSIFGTLQKDEAHIYTFEGAHGQEVAAMIQFALAGDTHYVVELWDDGYNRLAYGQGGYNSGTITLVYELRRSGGYMLVLIGRPTGPRGGYALGIDLLDR